MFTGTHKRGDSVCFEQLYSLTALYHLTHRDWEIFKEQQKHKIFQLSLPWVRTGGSVQLNIGHVF